MHLSGVLGWPVLAAIHQVRDPPWITHPEAWAKETAELEKLLSGWLGQSSGRISSYAGVLQALEERKMCKKSSAHHAQIKRRHLRCGSVLNAKAMEDLTEIIVMPSLTCNTPYL